MIYRVLSCVFFVIFISGAVCGEECPLSLFDQSSAHTCDYSLVTPFSYELNSTDIHCTEHVNFGGGWGCERINGYTLTAENCTMRDFNKSAVYCTITSYPKLSLPMYLNYTFFNCDCDGKHIIRCYLTVVARYDIWAAVVTICMLTIYILMYTYVEWFRNIINSIFTILVLLVITGNTTEKLFNEYTGRVEN